MTLRALVFDVDGTLAETEELHRAAFNEAFAGFGIPWRWNRTLYGRLLKTTGGNERIRAWVEQIGGQVSEARVAELHDAKTEIYARRMREKGAPLREGIASLMERGRREGLLLAVATTTSRPNVEALCAAAFGKAPLEVFDAVAAGDEVARKKPAPDVYRLALERLDLPAGACLALEDSANGVAAARAAGLAVVACKGIYTESEDHAEATRQVRSFGEVASAPDLSDFLRPAA